MIGELERKFYWTLPCPDDRIAREEVLLDPTIPDDRIAREEGWLQMIG